MYGIKNPPFCDTSQRSKLWHLLNTPGATHHGQKRRKDKKPSKEAKNNLKKRTKKEEKKHLKKKAKKRAKKAKKAKKERAKQIQRAESNQPRPAVVTSEQRTEMIRIAAYYLAQKHGFQGDSELDNWDRAEHEVDAIINQTKG